MSSDLLKRMQELPHDTDRVADYKKAFAFLERLSPATAENIQEVPVWRYSPEAWAKRGGPFTAVVFGQRGDEPVVAVQDKCRIEKEYNVCHEAFHIVINKDPELKYDYQRCDLLPETERLPEYILKGDGRWTIQEHYWLIHTLPLFEMYLWNSKTDRTRERMVECGADVHAKKRILAWSKGMNTDSVSTDDLRIYMREIIERVACISASESALGARFAKIMRDISDDESDDLDDFAKNASPW
jgi:hypothetical protein